MRNIVKFIPVAIAKHIVSDVINCGNDDGLANQDVVSITAKEPIWILVYNDFFNNFHVEWRITIAMHR